MFRTVSLTFLWEQMFALSAAITFEATLSMKTILEL